MIKKIKNNILHIILISIFVFLFFGCENKNIEGEASVSTGEIDANESSQKENLIEFGTYGNEKILWQVIEETNEKKVLLSKYILDAKPFNEIQENTTWERCSLRKWLNEDFYNNAFTDDEKEKILKTNVINPVNSVTNTSSGDNTEDYVYILSTDEAKKYFYKEGEDNKFVKELATKRISGLSADKISMCETKDKWYSDNNPYWLRTSGLYEADATFVNFNGYVSDSGANVSFDKNGVRPVIQIKN